MRWDISRLPQVPLRELRFLASASFRFGEALGGLGVFAGPLFTELGRLFRSSRAASSPCCRFGQPGLALATTGPVTATNDTSRPPARAPARRSPAALAPSPGPCRAKIGREWIGSPLKNRYSS